MIYKCVNMKIPTNKRVSYFLWLFMIVLCFSCNKNDSNTTTAPDNSDVNEGAPQIISQPQNQAVFRGHAVVFNVSVQGDSVLTYQWQKDGIDIPEATDSTLTILPAMIEDEGNYRVIVRNSKGEVVSSVATLSIISWLPTISSQPSNVNIPIGFNASFTVTATGVPDPTYQWQKNGIDIQDATLNNLTISAVDSGDIGTYRVLVSNRAGTDTSVDASLNIVSGKLYNMNHLSDGTFQRASTITVSGFWMDITEVTQTDYFVLTGVNPSFFTGAPTRPVETVTWFDAVLYCNARSKRDGMDTVYRYTNIIGTAFNGCTDLAGIIIDYSKKGYRLPTEAEWEYAYRGGKTTAYYWGSAWNLAQANNYCWNYNNSGKSSQHVGKKLPNAYGLFDMAGNVYEWCNDRYGSYTSGAQNNPIGPSSGDTRVFRGGSWFDDGNSNFSASSRFNCLPSEGSKSCGFRVVCTYVVDSITNHTIE